MQTAMEAMGNMGEARRRAALACIPMALVVAFIPHGVKLVALGSGYDNVEPRKKMTELKGDSPRDKLARRAQACHTNGLETFGIFSAAVLMAYAAKAKSSATMNAAIKFIVGRLVYTALYLGGVNVGISALRTLAFFHNMKCCGDLFQLAISAPLDKK